MVGVLCAFRPSSGSFTGLCVTEAESLADAGDKVLARLVDNMPGPQILHTAYTALPPKEALKRVSDLMTSKDSRLKSTVATPLQCFVEGHTYTSDLEDAFALLRVPKQVAEAAHAAHMRSIEPFWPDIYREDLSRGDSATSLAAFQHR